MEMPLAQPAGVSEREQTTHTAHVAITVAADFVGQSVQNQHPVLERLEWRHDFLELEVAAHFVGPIGGRDRAVGAEHDDQSLPRPGRAGEAEAWQPQEER